MPLTVAGIGCRASGDDGIGIALVEGLPDPGPGGDVELVVWENADALTLVAELLERHGPVIVADCSDMKAPPGTWRFFDTASAVLRVSPRNLSSHGLGAAEALAMARDLGFTWPVYVFGVQPYGVAPGRPMTPAMRARLPELVRALNRTIRRIVRRSSAEENASCRMPSN
ncbi:MAG: hydrogenase maturation protease [Deltaproteobacteria bacterium]|nr:hydrogenase maturation protease [Deltaproteobacteria bacterium]